MNRFRCKIGDLVKVDNAEFSTSWIGLCVWHDDCCPSRGGTPYKFSFLVGSDTITWTTHDLATVEAEVISESR